MSLASELVSILHKIIDGLGPLADKEALHSEVDQAAAPAAPEPAPEPAPPPEPDTPNPTLGTEATGYGPE